MFQPVLELFQNRRKAREVSMMAKISLQQQL